MDLARLILCILLALLLLVTGGGKVVRLRFSQHNRDELEVPALFWMITGVLELAAVVGLAVGTVIVPLAVTAASGVVLLMVGALVTRFRVTADNPRRAAIRQQSVADVVVLLIAAAIIILGAVAISRG